MLLYSTSDCLLCSHAVLIHCRNQGTGKNCAGGPDDLPGGPRCLGPDSTKLGLCCDATRTEHNCLTLLGDGSDWHDPIAAIAMLRQQSANGTTVPTCGQIRINGVTQSPFCCDQMDLPHCPTAAAAAVESQSALPAQLTETHDPTGQVCVVRAASLNLTP